MKSFPLKYGDVVLMQASAGGGVGDPLEREVELVRGEVFEGLITTERARDVYGVVFENGEVDLARTEEQRRRVKEQRRYFQIAGSDADWE